MHTPSRRFVFLALFLAAAAVLLAGAYHASVSLAAIGAAAALGVLAGGVFAALPDDEDATAERVPRDDVVTLSVVEPARVAPAPKPMPQPVAAEPDFDAPFAVSRPAAPAPADAAVAPRPRGVSAPPAPTPAAEPDAQARLWGPPTGWRPTEARPMPVPAAAPTPPPAAPSPAVRTPRRYAPGFEPRAEAPAAAASAPPRAEWARPQPAPARPTPAPRQEAPRYSPLGSATVRGMCSKCGTHLTLPTRRPVRATCPSCGHSRYLE